MMHSIPPSLSFSQISLEPYDTIIVFGVEGMVRKRERERERERDSEWYLIMFYASKHSSSPLSLPQMKALGHKVLHEARPGTQVIACRFQFPNWRPRSSYEAGPDSVWVYKI